MAKVYYDQDGDLKDLAGKTIAVIGYGSQGHAHALNLRDSGQKVIIGLPASSPSRAKAQAQKLEVFEPSEAARRGDVIVVLIPDPAQPAVYQQSIAPHLGPGRSWRALMLSGIDGCQLSDRDTSSAARSPSLPRG